MKTHETSSQGWVPDIVVVRMVQAALARGSLSVSSVSRGLGRASGQVQMGRMESVLNGLTDAQLRQIGITRKDIPEHAEFLVTYRDGGL